MREVAGLADCVRASQRNLVTSASDTIVTKSLRVVGANSHTNGHWCAIPRHIHTVSISGTTNRTTLTSGSLVVSIMTSRTDIALPGTPLFRVIILGTLINMGNCHCDSINCGFDDAVIGGTVRIVARNALQGRAASKSSGNTTV